MILGIHFGHDSSVAITDNRGLVICALAEERISRIKNHDGLPKRALKKILENISPDKIVEIVIGTHLLIPRWRAFQYFADVIPFAQHKQGMGAFGVIRNPDPGYLHFLEKKFKKCTPKEIIELAILQLFPSLGHARFVWVQHHDSHLGCALGTPSANPSLVLSLDGHGDGESGVVSTFKNSEFNVLHRSNQLDSLGELYSAVTERYSFTKNKHEGKVTGLAAFGEYSKAVDVLLSYVEVQEGKIGIKRVRNLKDSLVNKSFKRLGIQNNSKLLLNEIVDLAESETSNYADLAFAVQRVLEHSVEEIVKYYVRKTEIAHVVAAGGVFANVKMNQRISELESVNSFNVFPNMGDGGISLGATWFHLNQKGKLASGPKYENMFLAPSSSKEDDSYFSSLRNDKRFYIVDLNTNNLSSEISDRIANGKVVGLFTGNMEFGPRALGNRSILVDPRNSAINHLVNRRLSRTEFMPFAPVVREEDFKMFFEKNEGQDIDPFRYMTMTCIVKSEVRSSIPAVVHIDGTARPQIVSKETNPLLHEILGEFGRKYGVPILVNTSFNAHEEPIVYTLRDSVKSLIGGAVDLIVYQTSLIFNQS